ncbi:MAG TPA: hypothetical protein VGL71_13900, partial [Urbifossiella sp.]
IRALAHRAMMPEFAKNAFPLEPLLGAELVPFAVHIFGSVLVGELDYDAYFVAPYEGGQHLLLLRDDRLRSPEKNSMARVLSIFPQVLAALPVPDPRDALTHYAKSYALTTTDLGDETKITGTGNGELLATFDDRGRMKSLVGTGVAVPQPRPVASGKKKKPPVKVKKKVKAKTKVHSKKAAAAAKVKLKQKAPKPAARAKIKGKSKAKPAPKKKR